MKLLLAIVSAICLSISVQAQSNIFDIKFAYVDGIIVAGNNKSIVYPMGSKNTMLAKTWKQPSCPKPTIGDIIRFSQFSNKSEKTGKAVCEWVVISFASLGSIAKDSEGDVVAKTDGSFIKIGFSIKNISDNTLYVDTENMAIQLKKDAKDSKTNFQSPHVRGNRMISKEESEMDTSGAIPAGLTRNFYLVYEIPPNVNLVLFPVFSINDEIFLQKSKIHDSSMLLISFPVKHNIP